jgi:DHA1 family inner membrane transport protein
MLPWGITGWMFPPAQASRLVALAPELAPLTLPLNVSAVYFGIAAGSVLGGQVLRVAPPEALGLAGAATLLAGLALLWTSARPAPSPVGR